MIYTIKKMPMINVFALRDDLVTYFGAGPDRRNLKNAAASRIEIRTFWGAM
jgi:hypothetical protein